MEWFVALMLIAIAGAIGFFIGRNTSSDLKKVSELENIVVEKDRELHQYQHQVSNHFEKTAKLFGRVTEDYQTLFQHMANSSQQLVGKQPFKSALEHKSEINSVEEIFNGEDTFSNESLYRAHEYRNADEIEQEVEKEAPKKEESFENSADIINITSAKETFKEPPLDYAIKDKGVVNHNSLNREDNKK